MLIYKCILYSFIQPASQPVQSLCTYNISSKSKILCCWSLFVCTNIKVKTEIINYISSILYTTLLYSYNVKSNIVTFGVYCVHVHPSCAYSTHTMFHVTYAWTSFFTFVVKCRPYLFQFEILFKHLLIISIAGIFKLNMKSARSLCILWMLISKAGIHIVDFEKFVYLFYGIPTGIPLFISIFPFFTHIFVCWLNFFRFCLMYLQHEQFNPIKARIYKSK